MNIDNCDEDGEPIETIEAGVIDDDSEEEFKVDPKENGMEEDEEEIDDDGEDENLDDTFDHNQNADSPKKADSNIMTKMRKQILDLWKDHFNVPGTSLVEIDGETMNKWKTLFGPRTKKKTTSRKVSCPKKCGAKAFSSLGGLVYHFQRCGLNQTTDQSSYTCKICNQIISSGSIRGVIPHMTTMHLNDLPPVPQDLKEGLNYAFLTPKTRKTRGEGRKTRLKGEDSVRGRKRFSLTHIYYTDEDYVETTKEFRKQLVKDEVIFPDWLPKKENWKPMKQSEYEMYLPQASESCNFRIQNDPLWRRLNPFESIESSDHKTFFTGGPVRSAAWVPMGHNDQKQYLAIATALNFVDLHSYSEDETELGLIQIWDFGHLKLDNESNPVPKFVMGITHSFGLIWKMEWTPLGNSYQTIDKTVPHSCYPRLGLLAVAPGDGEIRILSVPHPDAIIKNGNKNKHLMFKPEPTVVLERPASGPTTREIPYICRTLSWSKIDDNILIAGGYGNGMIAVWNLFTCSKFLVIQTCNPMILKPIKSWMAHTSTVNSICWCPYPGSKLLASGGTLDRDVIIWDIEDVHVPSKIHRRGVVTDVEWPFRWSGIFTSFDDCFLSLQTNVNYIELAEDDVRNSLSCHKACVWVGYLLASNHVD